MRWRALASLVSLLWAHAAYGQSDEPSAPSEPATESGASAEEELPAGPIAGPSVEALSDAELEALGLESAGPRVDTSFHFWGFADLTSAVLIRPQGVTSIAQGKHQNFYIGNLNFYLSKNLSESFRTMAEVRLTYLPNGSFRVGPGGYEQVDTSTVDYANGQSLTRWGGIILQRVYLEWTLHRFATVRGGQFLTPFGIWNVDHGSPAYIPVQRPIPIVSPLYPERQMGFEVFGRFSASNDHTLGYHLTLSNGTGPISEYKDLDRNKAVGGRAYWEYFGKRTYIRAGVSGYYGRDTVAMPTAVLTATTIELNNKIRSQSDILALAGDLLVKRGGLHIQGEWGTQQRRYTEGGRGVHSLVSAPVAMGASADTFSWSGYSMVAYRFGGRFAITPYTTFQAARLTQANDSLPDARFDLVGFTLGLNLSLVEGVVLKLEYGRVSLTDAVPILTGDVNALQAQVAWAF